MDEVAKPPDSGSPDDGRRSRVHLTPHAWTIRGAVQARRSEIDEIALLGISVLDRAALQRMLTQMASNLSEEKGSTASA